MLTYAGVSLSLDDPDGAVQDWIDRYRPLDSILAPPAAYEDGRDRPQGNWPHAVGLPTFNWRTLPPDWRVNTLWWPTGASRFAVGLFLATQSAVAKIRKKISSSGGGTLAIGDGTRTIRPTMYMLPPRPLGASATSNPVMLLPLVDRRYFWQSSQCGQMLVGPSTAWATIRGNIVAGLGVSVAASEPSGYPAPDWSEWDRWHENAALALDGYAASVGQRFVATLSGSYSLQTAESGAAAFAQNSATALAGGNHGSAVCAAPGSVRIVFPKRQGGIVYQNGACETIVKYAQDYGFSSSAPGEATIHTTYQADYSARSGSADNSSELDSLADSIARDYYGWLAKQYSLTLPGIRSNWNLSGFDDYLWFYANARLRGGQDDEPGRSGYQCHTLIESIPPNVETQENLTQATITGSPRTLRPSPVHRAELTSGWTDPGSSLPHYATARLLYESSGANPPTGLLTKDGHNVTVFDTCGLKGGSASGDKLWVAALPADSEMFELIAAPATSYTVAIAKTGGTIAACDLNSLGLTTGTPTMPSATGCQLYFPNSSGKWATGITAKIWNPLPFAFTSEDVWVEYSNGQWIIRRAEGWVPHVNFASNSTPSGATASKFCNWDLEADYGSIASASGDTITIDCPVILRPFLVSWGLRAEFGFTSGTSSAYTYSAQPQDSGASSFGFFGESNWDIPVTVPAGTGPHTHTIQRNTSRASYSGSAVRILTEGDTIKLNGAITGGGSVSFHNLYGWVTITPMFGY